MGHPSYEPNSEETCKFHASTATKVIRMPSSRIWVWNIGCSWESSSAFQQMQSPDHLRLVRS